MPTVLAKNNDPIGDALRADAVAYWKLDEASGNRLDATGNGHTLSPLEAVSGVTGKVTNAANLTVAADNLLKRMDDTAFDTWGLTTLTIAGWLKVDDFAPVQDHACYWLMSPDNFDFGINQYILSLSPDVYYLDIYNADGEQLAFLAHSTVIVEGEWNFVLMEIDADLQTVSISVNGDKESSAFFASTPASTKPGRGFSLGGEVTLDGSFANYQMQGSIDEVGVWNRVLTTQEVAYLYNSGSGRSLYP